jgi:hydroxymethylpyrimidine pyrophosphatase-like HAD family hydrolase
MALTVVPTPEERIAQHEFSNKVGRHLIDTITPAQKKILALLEEDKNKTAAEKEELFKKSMLFMAAMLLQPLVSPLKIDDELTKRLYCADLLAVVLRLVLEIDKKQGEQHE